MRCGMCKEEILPGHDASDILQNGDRFHRVCAFRNISGSVGHLLGLCRCHGGGTGTMEDLPGATPYRASLNAWNVYQTLIRMSPERRARTKALARLAFDAGFIELYVIALVEDERERAYAC